MTEPRLLHLASDQEAVLRPVMTQWNCAYKECGEFFTESSGGKMCTRCQDAYYCSSSCQQSDWEHHKTECKRLWQVQREMKELQGFTKKGRARRPPIFQHLNHAFGFAATDYLVSVIARSALRLGRTDSKAKSHYLHFKLDYEAPPIERWSANNVKAVGDERDFFTFREVLIEPFIEQSEVLTRRKEEAEKAETDGNGRVGAFCVLFTATRTDVSEIKKEEAGVLDYCMLRHSNPELTPHYPPPLDQRSLNPQWPKLLNLFDALSLPSTKLEEISADRRLILFADLAMSESADHLNCLPFKPLGGWAVLKRRVLNRQLENKLEKRREQRKALQ